MKTVRNKSHLRAHIHTIYFTRWLEQFFLLMKLHVGFYQHLVTVSHQSLCEKYIYWRKCWHVPYLLMCMLKHFDLCLHFPSQLLHPEVSVLLLICSVFSFRCQLLPVFYVIQRQISELRLSGDECVCVWACNSRLHHCFQTNTMSELCDCVKLTAYLHCCRDTIVKTLNLSVTLFRCGTIHQRSGGGSRPFRWFARSFSGHSSFNFHHLDCF